MQYGIIGNPLTHTFSPAYFKKKFAALGLPARYDAWPLPDIADLPALVAAKPDLRGFNVTIPYKEAILPYLHDTDAVAAEVGAVNCVAVKNGRMKGYNTDVIGFERSLIPLLTTAHTHALVLGSGGASRAVTYTLTQLGISYMILSTGGGRGTVPYDTITPAIAETHSLIINTTPLGMYPYVNAMPDIPYEAIGKSHLLFDLIYNPEETLFLAEGRKRGATVKNGFEMLCIQADESWDIWTRP